MKPAPFDYVAPATLDDAIGALATAGDDAKILAGGQSLVPLLNFRLSRPAALIDGHVLPYRLYYHERDYELVPGNAVSLFSEVDLTRIERLRRLAAESGAPVPSYIAFVVKAMALALGEFPYANRRIFRRLSVFAGGFTLQAADAVSADTPLDVGEVLNAVTGLTDHSLVEFSPREDRYRMLEPIREYAEERLIESGEMSIATAQAGQFLTHLATVDLAQGSASAGHPVALKGSVRKVSLSRIASSSVGVGGATQTSVGVTIRSTSAAASSRRSR